MRRGRNRYNFGTRCPGSKLSSAGSRYISLECDANKVKLENKVSKGYGLTFPPSTLYRTRGEESGITLDSKVRAANQVVQGVGIYPQSGMLTGLSEKIKGAKVMDSPSPAPPYTAARGKKQE
jgi:hypothetical protein